MTTNGAVERALKTLGDSDDRIHQAAADLLRRRGARGSLVDVGCGIGRLRDATRDLAASYLGVDIVRHPRLPPDVAFLRADVEREAIPVDSESADVVAAIETVEHLENPHAFTRELTRILKPGGWLVITTPNQLSILSLLSLVLKGRFVAFQDDAYPVHRSALLPNDLIRMARECGLSEAELTFTASGRIPLTSARYPRAMSRLFPQALSDNVLMAARK